MSRLLTVRNIATLKPKASRYEIGEGSGLFVAVEPTGTASFVHRCRDADGKPRRIVLGRARGEGAISLHAARESVAKARRQLEQGHTIPRPVLASAGDSVTNLAVQFLTKHHEANNRRGTVEAAE